MFHGLQNSASATRHHAALRSTIPAGSRRSLARAFTLIEILVVVAIIALLISILLPSLQQAREQARTVVCATNMRTCNQALLLYAASNRDYFPYDDYQVTNAASRAGSPAGLSAQGLNPWEFFHKYVQKSIPKEFTDFSKAPVITAIDSTKQRVILDWYICPSDKFYHTSNVKKNLPNGKTGIEYMLSYCINLNVPWDIVNSTTVMSVRKVSSVRRPAAKMIVTEVGDDAASLETKPWELRDRNGPPDLQNQIGFQIQHRGGTGGSNIVYVDGHVSFSKALLGSVPWYGLPPASAASFEDIAVYDRTKPATASFSGSPDGSNLIKQRAAPVK